MLLFPNLLLQLWVQMATAFQKPPERQHTHPVHQQEPLFSAAFSFKTSASPSDNAHTSLAPPSHFSLSRPTSSLPQIVQHRISIAAPFPSKHAHESHTEIPRRRMISGVLTEPLILISTSLGWWSVGDDGRRKEQEQGEVWQGLNGTGGTGSSVERLGIGDSHNSELYGVGGGFLFGKRWFFRYHESLYWVREVENWS